MGLPNDGAAGARGCQLSMAYFPARKDTGDVGDLSATPVGYLMPALYGEDFGADQTYEESKRIRPAALTYLDYLSLLETGGNIAFENTRNFMPWMYTLFMGEPSTAGVGDPYTHTFTPGTTQMFGIVEKNWTAAVAAMVDYYLLIAIKAMHFKIKPYGLAEITIDFMGLGKYSLEAAVKDASLTDDTTTIATDQLVTVCKEGGSTFSDFEEINIDLEWLDMARADYVGGQGVARGFKRGPFQASGSVLSVIRNDTLRAKARAQTASSLEAQWTWSANHSTNISLPYITFQRKKDLSASQRGELTHSYPFKSHDGGASLNTITHKCATATYTHPTT